MRPTCKSWLAGCLCAGLIAGCREQPSVQRPATRSTAATATPAIPSTQQISGDEKDPAKLLIHALLYRDPERVRKVLSEHRDFIDKPINGTRALAIACESKSLPLVKALMDFKPDLKIRTTDDKSMLWLAVSSDSLPVARYLIEQGCDPREVDKHGSTLLWAVDSKPMAQFLIGSGVDPKAINKQGDTALHAACRHSLRDVAELLIDSGVHVDTPGRWKMPPLHSAATTITGDPRSTVLMLLARGANIDARGFQGHTVIHECAFYNRLEMADLLLSRGAAVNLKDEHGKTPLDLAKEFSGKAERIRMMNLLIRHGAPGRIQPVPSDE